jgi:hypothetical protein
MHFTILHQHFAVSDFTRSEGKQHFITLNFPGSIAGAENSGSTISGDGEVQSPLAKSRETNATDWVRHVPHIWILHFVHVYENHIECLLDYQRPLVRSQPTIRYRLHQH